jgi:cyclopropane fatty-acyl-phospholipid synthase-like methyltransferase
VTAQPRYQSIAAHYVACLERHGDNHFGVDWPNEEDAHTRQRVMLDVIRPGIGAEPHRVLDFGCGASHLMEHIRAEKRTDIDYAGLDIAEPFVKLSQAKFPDMPFWCLDVLTDDVSALPRFDYAVMNGVFTEKLELSYDEMFDFMSRTVARVFSLVEVGIAFNVMSKHVDWERHDLFHVPFDEMAAFLIAHVTRNIVLRADYGLYEYTAYAYH